MGNILHLEYKDDDSFNKITVEEKQRKIAIIANENLILKNQINYLRKTIE